MNDAGEFVFRDGSGTQTRFGALVGGGYAPLDPAVSAGLTDGPAGTHVMRNLTGATMTFDAAGALIGSADARGQGLTFAYAAGVLTSVTDALGQTVTFGWDTGTGTNARVASASASDGRTVTYTYATTAGAKRLTAVTAVDGKTTTYAYNATTGGISQITDPMGFISARNTYDPTTKRITSQLSETSLKTTFAWDAATQTATITDPSGAVRKDTYNSLNLVKQVDGNGDVVETLYDGDNNQAASVDAQDQLSRSEYDDRDRLVRRVAPAPLYYAELWTYDDADRVTSYTDPDGGVTSYTYNAAGLPIAQENPDATTTSSTYTTGASGEPANLLASSTDQLGRVSTYTYNTTGDLVASTSPGGKTTTSTFDAQHRTTSTTTASGALTSYTYDAGGRVLTTTDPTGAVWTNTYDANGRLIKAADPGGRAEAYTYDKADRLIQTKDSAGRYYKTSFDGAGNVATTTDPVGAVTRYAYDDAGQLTSTTDPLGHTTTQAYDDGGRLTTLTYPTGEATTYTYDVLGRRTSTTDADGVTATTTYDWRGNPLAVTSATGGYQQTDYDAMGRPVSVSDSDGVMSTTSYDSAGQVVEQAKDRSTSDYVPDYYTDRTTYAYDRDGNRTNTVDPRGNVPGAAASAYTTTVAYDGDNRPVTSTDPLGRITTTAYDGASRPIIVTNPAGGTTKTAYNSVGWITSVIDPAGAKTAYTYDQGGNVTKRTDPLLHATTYTYDLAGQLLTQTDPLGRTTSMTYDLAGNTTGVVKPSGNATTAAGDGAASFAYDDANRVTTTGYSDATPGSTYTYTPAGRLTSVAKVAGTETLSSSSYTYDETGQPVTMVRTGPGESSANYAYTSAGRLAGVAWSTGMSAAYSCNSTGELTEVTSPGAGAVPTVAYGYDPAGRISTVTRSGPAPTTTTAAFDGAGQLSTLTHSAGGTVLSSYQLTRDTRGNPVQVDATTGTSATSALYSFDSVSRITSQCRPTTGTVCTTAAPKTTYTYDKAGNRKTEAVRTKTGTVVSTATTASAYDTADQLLTETLAGITNVSNTWTLNGTLATTTTPVGTQTSTTDLAGELVSFASDGSTTGFTYDTQGNRTSRTVDGALDATWSWEDITGLAVRTGEYDATGTLTTAWLPDPTSTTGAPLAEVNDQVASWMLSDPFANTTAAITTNTATLSGERTLDAFGAPLATATGTLTTSAIGFAGQYLDSRTGLYDMRARDYDPSTARFTATDPAQIPTGMPYAAGYSYSLNNPMTLIDATGKTPTNVGPSGYNDWSYQYPGGGTPRAPRGPIQYSEVKVGYSPEQMEINRLYGEQMVDEWIRNGAAPWQVTLYHCQESIDRVLGPATPLIAVTAGMALGAQGASSSRTALPKLPGTFADSFASGAYTTRTFKAGTIFYRAEGTGQGVGSFVGFSKPATVVDAEKMYNIAKWGNSADVVTTYRLTQDTTMYVGDVAGGSGRQALLPRGASPDLAFQQLSQEVLH